MIIPHRFSTISDCKEVYMCYESSLVCEINHWLDTSRSEASRSDACPLAHLQLVSENVTKDDSENFFLNH